MHRFLVFGLIVFFIVSLTGCQKEADLKLLRPLRTVLIAPPVKGNAQILTGQVAAHSYVNASFRIAGQVATRWVNAGQRVKEGTLLATLDDKVVKDEHTQATASLLAARATLSQTSLRAKRVSSLIANKAVSRNEYDLVLRQQKEALAAVDAANAQVHSAKEKLSYTTLRSEVAGIIVNRLVEQGEVVAAGQPVFKIAADGALDALFDVPEELVARGVEIGTKVQVCLDRKPSLCTEGTIYEMSPETDATTRTYQTKLVLAHAVPEMLLGAIVRGSFVCAHSNVLRVPSQALSTHEGKASVWVVKETKTPHVYTVEPRFITIAAYEKEFVLVSEGVEEGERIASAGVHLLLPGQKVRLEASSAH